MMFTRHTSPRFWGMLLVLVSISLLTTCRGSGGAATAHEDLNTRLLVSAPTVPLPAGQPVEVRSRTADSDNPISHVELYALQLPDGQRNVLIRADAATLEKQTVFEAAQIFTPLLEGTYEFVVVGYNRRGERARSESIRFDVKRQQ